MKHVKTINVYGLFVNKHMVLVYAAKYNSLTLLDHVLQERGNRLILYRAVGEAARRGYRDAIIRIFDAIIRIFDYVEDNNQPLLKALYETAVSDAFAFSIVFAESLLHEPPIRASIGVDDVLNNVFALIVRASSYDRARWILAHANIRPERKIDAIVQTRYLTQIVLELIADPDVDPYEIDMKRIRGQNAGLVKDAVKAERARRGKRQRTRAARATVK